MNSKQYSLFIRSLTAFFLGSSLHTVCFALTATEVTNGKDHRMISRYSGAILQNFSEENFASLTIPASPGKFVADKLAFEKSSQAEGKLSAYFYIQPKGKSALEVFRNYQNALNQASFTTLYMCEMQACDQALIKEIYANTVVEPRKWKAERGSPSSAISRDVRFISAKLTKNGEEIYALLFVAEPDSVWQAPTSVLLVTEVAALETGKVLVNTEALQKGLANEGKVALYGIYFDTGKAEIKPESKGQLDAMAKLLDANKTIKVLIVGHTDNQGTIESNLSLSQRRAEAIVATLVKDYKIDVKRVSARGVANFAPVASNSGEAGRAKNRRVELVEM